MGHDRHDTPSLHDRLVLGDALERIRPLRLRGNSGLNDLEYGRVAALLKQVEQCRNRFTHGHPEAIDDTLVEELVAG